MLQNILISKQMIIQNLLHKHKTNKYTIFLVESIVGENRK